MPNAKVLEAKKATVAALAEQLKGAQSGVLVDYSGSPWQRIPSCAQSCATAR